MQNILVVEDEKMIRKGIVAMIQRANVPVGQIYECKNGEEALALLQEVPIDVMFTDIKMPKMDGIALVSAIQKLEQPPIVVVISGYDDFSYAVEMLRNGVREYLLKPVERERLYGVMQQIEAELKEKLNVQKRETKSFVQSIRFILHNAGLSEKELLDFEHSYEKDFYQGAYRVICIPKHTVSIPQSTYEIEDTDRQRIIIVDEACYLALKAKTTSLYCGVSESFQGLRFLQQAYQQAFIARMEAYFQQTPWMVYSNGIVLGEKEGFEKEQDQFIQLLSISRTKDAIAILKTLYELVECRTFNPRVFAQFTQGIVTKLPKTFQKVVEINQSLDDFYYPWSFDTAQQYLLLLIEWIEGFSLKLNEELDDYENKQKIQQALKYIHQHFASNLNMAVVSNHVEMNYTLFSQLFKQYTGKNFVKYLHELRLDESKKLLKETDLKIFEISSKVGFTDEKHYMKLFKSTCGISPSEYRKTLHLN